MSVIYNTSDDVLKGLQNLLENELSTKILKPLLQKIYRCNVASMAKAGGSDNDLIVHKVDELGDPCTISVQVRRLSQQFGFEYGRNEQKLVRHLSAIRRKGVVCDVTGSRLKVHKVILVTPFAIDRNVESGYFKALNIAVRTHNIRLIDGTELAELIHKHCSELLGLLVDKCYLINQSIRQTLDKDLLMSTTKMAIEQHGVDRYCPVSVAPRGRYLNSETLLCSMARDYANEPSLQHKPFHLDDETARYDIEPLLDSGENVALLGEAGSGKSTALKRYAYKLLSKQTDKLVIFTSLYRVALCAESLNSCSILDGLVGYLAQIDSQVSVAALSAHLSRYPTVVILDSIDEAIVEHPWVINGLVAFSQSFGHCQIITSSRFSVDGLSDIPFFHLSILPFDAAQKRLFFDQWFAEDTDKAEQILTHLAENPKLDEIVANPLSATILCVLCTNQVPLPKTEAALYKKRIEMLAGVYDAYRGVRRTSCEPSFLMDVARVIAFGMHIRKRSSFDKAFALSICLKFYTDPNQLAHIKRAIDELISPTEIITPALNGGYNFGHLRVQEFLASEELINRRNVNYKELIKDKWWDETFVLMSQHAREIESIVNEVCNSGYVGKVKPLLMKMIASRSKLEKEVFTKRVNQSFNYEHGGFY